MKHRIITTLLFFIFLTTATSQDDSNYHFCGTTNDAPAILDYQGYASFVHNFLNQSKSRSSANPDTIPVQLYMFTKSDGSERGDPQIVIDALLESNEYFRGAGFIFHICEQDIEFINDDYFFEYNVSEMGDSLRRTYNKKAALELYIVNSVIFNDGRAVSGIGSSISFTGGYTVCDYSAVSVGLFVHELGHCMHLRHTHGKYNFESSDCEGSEFGLGLDDLVVCKGAVRYDNRPDIDENNDGISDCLQTGDNVCDTPADPQLGLAGMLEPILGADGKYTCQYVGTVRDPYGDLYNPILNNFMAYGKCGELALTAGQQAKMRYALENSGLQFLCGACSDHTAPVIRTVTKTNDGTVGSLRWALSCASLSSAPVTIQFDLPGNDSIIYLERSLPPLIGNVKIDGSLPNGNRVILDGGLMEREWDSGIVFKGNSLEVENIKLQNFPNDGIHVSEAISTINFQNCEINNCGRLSDWGSGIKINNCSDDITFDKLRVTQNKRGINIGVARNISIQNSIIEDNGNIGIKVDSMMVLRLNDLSIQNNQGSGVFVAESTGAFIENVQIINNEHNGINITGKEELSIKNALITGNGSTGISIRDFSSCIIEDVTSNKNTRGLSFESIPKMVLNDFICTENSSYGLFGSEGGDFSGQNITINTNKYDGIRIDSLGKFFLENAHLNNNNTGIFIGKADSIQIRNSSANQGERNGIELSSANTVELENIEIIGNQYTGFSAKGEKNIILHQLTVNNNGSTGISLQDFSSCQVDSISLDGNGSGLFFKNIPSIDLHNTVLTNHKFKAISGVDCGDLKASNLLVENNSSHGLHFDQLNYLDIDDIDFKKNGAGIYIQQVDSISVKDVTAIENTGTGFSFAGILNADIQRITSNQNQGRGLYLKGEGNVSLKQIEVNTNGNSGIEIDSINNIIFKEITANDNESSGIKVGHSNNVFSENIQVNGSKYGGIDISGKEEVFLKYTFSNGNGYSGIALRDFSSCSIDSVSTNQNNTGFFFRSIPKISLSNFTANNNTSYGIDGTEGGELIGNNITILNNERDGINIDSLGKLHLENIQVNENSDGIFVGKADSILLKDASVNQGKRSGISVQAANTVEIEHVEIIGNKNTGLFVKGDISIKLHNLIVNKNESTGINIQDFTRCTLDSLSLDGNTSGLFFKNIPNIDLHNSTFTNHVFKAINGVDCGDFISSNLIVENNGGFGLHFTQLNKLDIFDIDLKKNGRGVYVEAVDSVKIKEITAIENTGTGFSLAGILDGNIRDVKSIQNQGSGIYLKGDGNILLNDAEVLENQSTGVFIQDFADSKIKRLQINGNSTGLSLKDTKTIQLDSIDIKENKGRGISVTDIGILQGMNIQIADNGNYGIYVNSADKINLNKSLITNNERGFTINSIVDFTISEVDILYNKSTGLAIEEASTVNLRNLKSSHNTGSGVVINAVETIDLDQIDIENNKGTGLFVAGQNILTISNTFINNNTETGMSLRNFLSASINEVVVDSNRTGLYIDGITSLQINELNAAQNSSRGIDYLNGNQVFLKNSAFLNNGGTGLSFNKISKVELSEIRSNSNGWAGIYIEEASEVDLNELLIDNNEKYGLEIIESSNLQLFNTGVGSNKSGGFICRMCNTGKIGDANKPNWFYNNDGVGVTLSGSTNIDLHNNQIGLDMEDTIGSNQSGISVTGGSNNIRIGGDIEALKNKIVNHPSYGVTVSSNVYDTQININEFSCNDNGIIIYSGGNNGVKRPTINPIRDRFGLSGTAENGSKVSIYRTSTDCTSCEGESFLVNVTSNGDWRHIFNEPMEIGDKFTVISADGKNSSSFSACRTFDCSPSFQPSVNDAQVSTLCEGDTLMLVAKGGTQYGWSNGESTAENNIYSPGTYEVTVTGEYGCQTVVSHEVLLEATPDFSIEDSGDESNCLGTERTLTVLGGLNYLWDTGDTSRIVVVDTFREYTVTVTSNGCSKKESILVKGQIPISLTTTQIICQGESYESYTETGVYEDVFLGSNGCDSIRVLELEVRSNIENTINQIICEGEEFEGYKEAGVYEDTFAAINGCDSLRTLVLEILPNTISTAVQTICEGTSFEGYSTSGIYQDAFTASNGCDSTRILELIVIDKVENRIEQVLCAGEAYLGYDVSGTYEDTFTGESGCDSTRTLSLTILLENTIDISQSICEGESYEGYELPGNYIDSFIGSTGCDSIRTLTLTVTSSQTNEFSRTICSGESVESYTSSDQYIDVFQSSNGCDSTRILNLIVNEIIEIEETVNICAGTSHEGYTESGIYTDTYSNENGCDSIRTLTIEVTEVARINEEVIICEGESYKGYSESGVYVEEFSSSDCDTIYNLNLEVVPHYEVSIEKFICTNQSYEGYTESGDYTDTFSSINGCDSIRHLQLISEDRIIIAMDTSICKGESVEGYFEKGSYIDIFQSQTGCDSLRILDVNILSENNPQCLMTNTIDLDVSNYISIYPNPTNALIRLDFLENRNPATTITLSIFDTQGILLLNRTMNMENTTINLEGISAGLHIVLIDTGEVQYFKRIVKL